MKLGEIAKITEAELKGDSSFAIDSLAAIPETAEENQLALIFPGKFSKASKLIKASKARTLLVSEELNKDLEFQKYCEENSSLNLLIVARPKYALMKLIGNFAKARYRTSTKVHATAVIDPSAKIADDVSVDALSFVGPRSTIAKGTVIYPRVYIGADVTIGEDCEIRPGAVIEDYSVLGSRVIIQSNAVIGGDGYSYITKDPTNLEKLQKGDFNFSFERQIQNKIISAGNVILEDDVEIGSSTCVDRGSIGATRIEQGTKIDNLCQIAHNVQIGKDCLIIAGTGIAGSAKIGDRVTMAGASGCGDGVTIGNDVVVGAFSAVNSDVDPFLPVLGAPAVPYGEFMKRQRAMVRLPKLQDEFRKLKTKVEELVRTFEATRK